jgi:nucleotide-binding universal stress UspA family protein
MAEDLRLDGLVVTTEVRTGAASDEIIRAAVDYGADLIVMGRGERGALRHLLGGIPEQVSRRVNCPVLTVGCHGGARMAAA